MWSDMIDRKDGKLFFSKFPYDYTKRFFQILVSVYFVNTVIDIIAACFSFRVSDPSYFQDNSMIDAVCTVIEPVTIFFISVGCVWCGYRLQNHIVQAKLGFHSLVKVIFTLNITMIIIAATYLARAILILRLVYFMPKGYRDAMDTEYYVWVICTRWLPYNFCSFCLIYSMKSSGADVANKNNLREKAGSDTDSLNTMSHSTHGRAMSLPLIQNEERNNVSDDRDSSLSADSASFLSSSHLSDLPYLNSRFASSDRVLSVEQVHSSHLSQFHVQNSLHSSNATLAYSETNHAYSPSSSRSVLSSTVSDR
ncbi:hypothetical protein EON63_08920 [archaeon]|nr:MAG: hypothetical protein EON63_08920 [archaeon]